MRFSVTYLALFAQAVLASSSYIVQINKEYSFEDFLQQQIAKILGKTSLDDSSKIEIGDFKAFVSDFGDDLLDQLKSDSLISNIFPNEDISIFDSPEQANSLKKRYRQVLGQPKLESIFEKRDDVTTQKNAPRHLARISSREGIYNKDGPFEYKYRETGKGVTVYIGDSGINIDNDEFEGRAKFGTNTVDDKEGDEHGHGTNVAGIVGSKTYGVAKGVNIVDVKVLNANGGGSIEGVLKGIEWANNDRKKNNAKAVLNLSLGGGFNDALNEAVNSAYDDGLLVVTAAGNKNSDASKQSPGAANKALDVGALDDKTDTIAIYSNWGPKVDIFAPGAYVESASNDPSTNGQSQWFGTSQASPGVAGVAALLLEKGITYTSVKAELIRLSTKNAISKQTYDNNDNYSETVNRVLYNGVVESLDRVSSPSTEKQDESLKKFIE